MFNTVLGARPLQPDGRAFYYADYNFAGRKVYSSHRFPCCSGTLPQVAADYGINAYLKDPAGLYVNLYLPSSVRWMQSGGARLARAERRLSVRRCGRDARRGFAAARLHALLAHPAVGQARAHRGERHAAGRARLEPGSFAAVTRRWADGDRIDLELPRALRLEPLDRTHPDTVALLAGPLVLFPVRTGGEPPRPQRAELLAARQVAPRRWQMTVGDTAVTLLPYVEIDAEHYATVVTLAA